jgi:hypothetical protein
MQQWEFRLSTGSTEAQHADPLSVGEKRCR